MPTLERGQRIRVGLRSMAEERVLVIDDEPAVRGIIAAMLERSGYLTSTAGGADEALAQLKQNPDYDLVMSDVMMPGIDGLNLLDQFSENHPQIPVVMLTAVHDVHVAASAFRRGAIDYLMKPCDHAHLLAVVTRALEHGRLRRQNALYQRNLEDMVLARTASLRAAMQELERSYDITLEVMGDALDLRDAETEGHSRRVTAYTIALGREMGLSDCELAVIARGAFLHDIGKIATPDCILLKPGKLDADETFIMRQHCERGYAMVRKIPFLTEASEIVYAHQESYDGSGYPRGLTGQEIPLGARIFAIADTLDAITSDRPYRKAGRFKDAREEIERCAGRQFDPEIVRIFLNMSSSSWEDLRAAILAMSWSQGSAKLCHPESVPALCA